MIIQNTEPNVAPNGAQPPAPSCEQIWHGVGVSEGVAYGKILRVQSGARVAYRRTLRDEEIESEVERFQVAVSHTREQIASVKAQAEKHLGEDHARIFDAHLLMLEDRVLIDDTIACIYEQKVAATWAVKIVTDRILVAYAEIENEYLRSRATDIKDVSKRLLALLSETPAAKQHQITEDTIIVTEDLMPSMFAEFDFSKVRAIVADAGGWTSHAAIIARGLCIPAVFGVRDFYARARTGDALLVDAKKSRIVLSPNAETLAQHETHLADEHQKRSHINKIEIVDDAPTRTVDGEEIRLRANVELPIEYEGVKRYNAEGIGLYRSEFLWSQHNRMPTEDEQVEAYTEIVQLAGAAGAMIRFFDLGGEKVGLGNAAIVEAEHERNPALGLRAIRLCLRHEDVLRTQARACLRAARYGNLSVVLPMISDIADVRQAKRMINEEREKLQRENVAIGALRIGAMIEIPSAVFVAEALAREVDFFSLGTNDLVQYLLAVDRGNEMVAAWFRTLHPAVLHALHKTFNAARNAKIEAVVCGEMAATPVYAFILIGLGARDLSMTPNSIPRVRKMIRLVDASHARSIVEACLLCDGADAVEELVRERLSRELPQVFSLENLPESKAAK